MADQTAVIHYFRADTLLATESLWGRATAPAICALFQEEIVKRATTRAGTGWLQWVTVEVGGTGVGEGEEQEEAAGQGEETKTIDTVGTGKQGQSAHALFAEWPIKMPTTSPAGPLIRRHVNQSWNSTLINTGFRWSCLPTYLSNDTNAIWSNTCTSVKCLLLGTENARFSLTLSVSVYEDPATSDVHLLYP